MAVRYLDPCAVDDGVFFLLAAGLVIDRNAAAPGHGNVVAFLVFHRIQVEILHDAGILRFEDGLLNNLARRTADVEGPHRELGAGLADGLRGNDADRLADIYELAAAEVSAVAHLADAAKRLAREHRADLDAIDAGLLDPLDEVLVDLPLGADDHFLGDRVLHIFGRNPTEEALGERLDDLAAFDEGADDDAVRRSAVVLGDDYVLRYVDEAPREIPGVGRFH